MKCEICGKECDNLGAHMYQKHREALPLEIKVDETIKEKPLSELVSEMKDLLKPYQNEISIRTFEKGGKLKEIEITARIQL